MHSPLLMATLLGEPLSDTCSPAMAINATRGDLRRAESTNFIVISGSRQHSAMEIASLCETLCAKFQKQWCAEKCEAAWKPKCEVVIHVSRGNYLAVVGRGGAKTYASSLIGFGNDKEVLRRRIDICGEGQRGIAALPHELTHIVLAGVFDGHQPPRWADEGLAVLADPDKKQSLHQRDLTNCLANGTEFRLLELLTMESYPSPSRVPAFYAQSASLAAFLMARAEPLQFIEFLGIASKHGYDHALKQIYSIEDVDHLERLWREQFSRSSQK